LKRLLTLRNDVGLISEEYDPIAKRQLGNFPQAFTHLALVNCARILSGDEKFREPLRPDSRRSSSMKLRIQRHPLGARFGGGNQAPNQILNRDDAAQVSLPIQNGCQSQAAQREGAAQFDRPAHPH